MLGLMRCKTYNTTVDKFNVELARQRLSHAEELHLVKIVCAEARAKAQAADAECARITAMHATRIRLCHMPIDPIEMTARARAVEPSIRCEWDGEKLVCYADRELTEAEFEGMVAAIMPRFDRT